MKVAVMNYIDGSVDIIDADIKPTHDFDWELWLSEHGYDVSSCEWMTDVKQLTFKTAE